MNQIIRTLYFILCFVVISAWLSEDIFAQRGRGGGRRGGGVSRGGGGMNRGGGGMNRGGGMNFNRPSIGHSPSMSRPAQRPAMNNPSFGRPSFGNLPKDRPSIDRPSKDRPSIDRPSGERRSGERPSGGWPAEEQLSQDQFKNFFDMDKPFKRSAVPPGSGSKGDFLQQRPSTGETRPSARPKPSQLPDTGNRPAVKPPGEKPPATGTRPTKPPQTGTRPPAERPPLAGHQPVKRPPNSRPIGERPPGSRPPNYRPPGYRPPRPGHLPSYGRRYWNRHSYYLYRWYTYPNNWWTVADVGMVTDWLVNDFVGDPVYYDYGTNLYYDGDDVYYDGEVVASADDYAKQAQAIATNVPEVDVEKVEWLPLGVFALTQKDDTAEDATLFLQLAISKEGIIAGSFQNKATDKSFEVEGTIDRKSQRAAWGPVGESWPIVETGIANLTENESGILIHFDDGQTQQWNMFRLDEPKEDQGESADKKSEPTDKKQEK